jgi:Protein kinase domain
MKNKKKKLIRFRFRFFFQKKKMANKILIKCYYEGTIRILSLPEQPTPNELRLYFEKPEVFGERVDVDKYADHEDELITVRSDADMIGAFEIYYIQKQLQPTKIHILKLYLSKRRHLESQDEQNDNDVVGTHFKNGSSSGASARRRGSAVSASSSSSSSSSSRDRQYGGISASADLDEKAKQGNHERVSRHRGSSNESKHVVRSRSGSGSIGSFPLDLPRLERVNESGGDVDLHKKGDDAHADDDDDDDDDGGDDDDDHDDDHDDVDSVPLRHTSSRIPILKDDGDADAVESAAKREKREKRERRQARKDEKRLRRLSAAAHRSGSGVFVDDAASASSVAGDSDAEEERRRMMTRNDSASSALVSQHVDSMLKGDNPASEAAAASDDMMPPLRTPPPSPPLSPAHPLVKRNSVGSVNDSLSVSSSVGSLLDEDGSALSALGSLTRSLVSPTGSFRLSASVDDVAEIGSDPPPLRTPPPSPKSSRDRSSSPEVDAHDGEPQRARALSDAVYQNSLRNRHEQQQQQQQQVMVDSSEPPPPLRTPPPSPPRGRPHSSDSIVDAQPAIGGARLLSSSSSALSGSGGRQRSGSAVDMTIVSWQKLRKIGEGAYGRVYLCLTNVGNLIAIKQVPIPAVAKRAELDKLEEEVRMHATFDHMHIVRYLDVRRDEKYMNILLEYVPGGSIANLLYNIGGGFPESVIQVYTQQILLGLEYLHAKGIIHRDLKYVFFFFGLAKLRSVTNCLLFFFFFFSKRSQYIGGSRLMCQVGGFWLLQVDCRCDAVAKEQDDDGFAVLDGARGVAWHRSRSRCGYLVAWLHDHRDGDGQAAALRFGAGDGNVSDRLGRDAADSRLAERRCAFVYRAVPAARSG